MNGKAPSVLHCAMVAATASLIAAGEANAAMQVECPTPIRFREWNGAAAIVLERAQGAYRLFDYASAGRDEVDVHPTSVYATGCWALVAFARGLRPALLDSVPDTVRLEPTVVLQTAIWLVTTDDKRDDLERRAVHEVEGANQVFYDHAAGFELRIGVPEWEQESKAYDPQSVWHFIRIDPDTSNKNSPSSVIGDGCNSAVALAGRADPRPYMPDRLNIYVIDRVAGHAAETCSRVGHPEIIYLSQSEMQGSFGRLAHEVGHALGLWTPDRYGDDPEVRGHADRMGALFAEAVRGNLMNSGVNDVENITLGQIFRMHFDSTTWRQFLGRPEPSPGRRCAAEYPSWSEPCPPLALRPEVKWP